MIFLMLLIISPKGHESQEELFLRCLLSLTSCNDFPITDQLVQWIFVPWLLLKSPFSLVVNPTSCEGRSQVRGWGVNWVNLTQLRDHRPAAPGTQEATPEGVPSAQSLIDCSSTANTSTEGLKCPPKGLCLKQAHFKSTWH